MNGINENRNNRKPAQTAEALTGISHEEKEKCRNLMTAAIKKGVLVRGNCVVCGTSKRIEGHHNDYSKPLDVVWYCKTHHMQLHVVLSGRRNVIPELTRKKEEIRKFVKCGHSYKKIAGALGMPYQTVCRFIFNTGIYKDKPKNGDKNA